MPCCWRNPTAGGNGSIVVIWIGWNSPVHHWVRWWCKLFVCVCCLSDFCCLVFLYFFTSHWSNHLQLVFLFRIFLTFHPNTLSFSSQTQILTVHVTFFGPQVYDEKEDVLKYKLGLHELHPSIDWRTKHFIMNILELKGEFAWHGSETGIQNPGAQAWQRKLWWSWWSMVCLRSDWTWAPEKRKTHFATSYSTSMHIRYRKYSKVKSPLIKTTAARSDKEWAQVMMFAKATSMLEWDTWGILDQIGKPLKQL